MPTSHQGSVTKSITLQNVDQLQETIPDLMRRLTSEHHIPQVRQMQLLTRLRLASNFPSPSQRRKCVMARLQAISILGMHQNVRYLYSTNSITHTHTLCMYVCSVFSGPP